MVTLTMLYYHRVDMIPPSPNPTHRPGSHGYTRVVRTLPVAEKLMLGVGGEKPLRSTCAYIDVKGHRAYAART